MATDAAFDPKAKANKPLIDFIGNQRVLIVDAFSASRNTLRKIFTEFGVKSANLEITESFSEAEPKMLSLQPTLIIADYIFNRKSAFELFEVTKSQYPNRLDTIFIVTADAETPLLLNRIEDEEIDSLCARPFTYSSLQKRILDLVRSRLSPSAYQRTLCDGRARLTLGKIEEAMVEFVKAKPLDPRPVAAWCYEGAARFKLRQIEAAELCFKESLKLDPKNYKGLAGLMECCLTQQKFEQAYDVSRCILAEHAVRPRRLPGLIRAAVMCGKFDDVLQFYDFYMKLDEVDEQLINSVSAGLLVCSKFQMKKGLRAEAGVTLRKAMIACKGKAIYLKEILASMILNGMSDDIVPILASAPPEVKNSTEIRMAEFEYQYQAGATAGRMVEMGLDMIKQGIKNPRIYEIVIQKSIALKRRPQLIEELVGEACKEFPDHAHLFKVSFKAAS
jgi:tetratricopeptide (TPR) repeat protein